MNQKYSEAVIGVLLLALAAKYYETNPYAAVGIAAIGLWVIFKK